jgi:hypothetical protein
MKKRKPRSHLCRWSCGKETWNHSGICDECWRGAELLRSNTDEGYRTWWERKGAIEAAKVPNPKRQAAARKASAARRLKRAEFNAESLAAAPSSEGAGVGPGEER